MPIILQHRGRSFENTFRELLERSSLDSIVVVVPTKRRIRHLTREVLSAASRGVSPALPLHTLESLATTLYESAPGARSIVRGTVRTLVFDSAVRSIAGGLSYFRPKERDRRLFQGTFDKVVDVITELKESGVYPALLEEESSDAPLDERPKLVDIAAIYREYDRQLASLRAEDPGGVFRWLYRECPQELFDRIFRRAYPHVSTISLAGFDEFTPPEMGFLRKLCGLQGVAVSLVFDFQHGNPELFGHLESNYAELRDLGFREEPAGASEASSLWSVAREERATDVRDLSLHIARTLFRAGEDLPRRDGTGRVTVVRGRNRIHEIEIICRLIKKLSADHPGRDLSAICLAMPRVDLYTEIVREQFRRFDIPVNVTDRWILRTSPVVVTIMGLLRMRIGGFRRDDVLRVAGSPYVRIGSPGEELDAANLTLVSRRLRIVSGQRSWSAKIGRRLESVRRQMAGSQAEGELEALRLEEASLLRADRDIAALRRRTAPFGGALAPSDFLRALTELFAATDLPARIVGQAPHKSTEEIERDVRAYAAFLDIAGDVAGMLALRDGPRTAHSAQTYFDEIKLLLARERYNIREQYGKGVLVTSIEETRGLDIDVMIVAGLVDGELPSVYDPEVFLSAARRKLRERRHDWQDRYLFYQAATNWREHLYLTYPMRDGELELVRSSFVDAFLKILQVEHWEGRGDYPLAHVLCTEEDVLQWWASQGPGARDEARSVFPPALGHAFDEVARVIAMERSRSGGHDLPHFEGLIAASLSPRGADALERMRARTYSVSQLESYRACPFQFFAERLLRLSVAEDFREDLTPLERGTLFHEALFAFFTERRESGLPPLAGCSDAEFEQALSRLSAIVREKLAGVDLPDAFWEIDKELIVGGELSRHSLLYKFLEHERGRQLQTEPSYFEVSFGAGVAALGGTDRTLSREEPVVAGGIHLRGRIDRIETGDGFFAVVDYKTGRMLPTAEEIRTGSSMQLPLYLHAAAQLLEQSGLEALVPAAGLYYQLRDPVQIRLGVGSAEYRGRAFEARSGSAAVVATGEMMREVIRQSISTAEQCVDGIARGRFPLTDPENSDKVCTYCPYKTMCRIQSVRYVRSQEKENV